MLTVLRGDAKEWVPKIGRCAWRLYSRAPRVIRLSISPGSARRTGRSSFALSTDGGDTDPYGRTCRARR